MGNKIKIEKMRTINIETKQLNIYKYLIFSQSNNTTVIKNSYQIARKYNTGGN